MFLGVVFHQKLIGGGPKCPTCVLHVKNTCFLLIIHLFLHIKYVFLHPKTITFVRICVFDFGRGNIRDNFPPKNLLVMVSHASHMFSMLKTIFCG